MDKLRQAQTSTIQGNTITVGGGPSMSSTPKHELIVNSVDSLCQAVDELYGLLDRISHPDVKSCIDGSPQVREITSLQSVLRDTPELIVNQAARIKDIKSNLESVLF